jgi:acyl-CoA thioesterase FadM
MMIHYFKEAQLATPLCISGRLLEHDVKRIRLWLEMTAGPNGPRLAASEQLLISIDQSGSRPRVAEWLPATLQELDSLARIHSKLPLPPQAGQGISLSQKRSMSR